MRQQRARTGEQSTDSVNLQLVFEDGDYMIAGES